VARKRARGGRVLGEPWAVTSRIGSFGVWVGGPQVHIGSVVGVADYGFADSFGAPSFELRFTDL
jgi:hypothetical protein